MKPPANREHDPSRDVPGQLVKSDADSMSEVRERFISDHQQLRGKVSVVTTLALNVLRGDEELASALRLKGEDLYSSLHEHMRWEEQNLLPALADDQARTSMTHAMIKEHEQQRSRLVASLARLRSDGESMSAIAKECISLVRWLEVEMATEEREVLRFLGDRG